MREVEIILSKEVLKKVKELYAHNASIVLNHQSCNNCTGTLSLNTLGDVCDEVIREISSRMSVCRTHILSTVFQSISESHRWPKLQEHKRLEELIKHEDIDFTSDRGVNHKNNINAEKMVGNIRSFNLSRGVSPAPYFPY